MSAAAAHRAAARANGKRKGWKKKAFKSKKRKGLLLTEHRREWQFERSTISVGEREREIRCCAHQLSSARCPRGRGARAEERVPMASRPLSMEAGNRCRYFSMISGIHFCATPMQHTEASAPSKQPPSATSTLDGWRERAARDLHLADAFVVGRMGREEIGRFHALRCMQPLEPARPKHEVSRGVWCSGSAGGKRRVERSSSAYVQLWCFQERSVTGVRQKMQRNIIGLTFHAPRERQI
jgi:hypothetical protein